MHSNIHMFPTERGEEQLNSHLESSIIYSHHFFFFLLLISLITTGTNLGQIRIFYIGCHQSSGWLLHLNCLLRASTQKKLGWKVELIKVT